MRPVCGANPKRQIFSQGRECSRKSNRPLSSFAAAWRARTSSGGAGASSHRARVSSPARVRAVHSNSKTEARPKRSRSRAQGCDGSRRNARRYSLFPPNGPPGAPALAHKSGWPREHAVTRRMSRPCTTARTTNAAIGISSSRSATVEVAQPEQDPGHSQRGQGKLRIAGKPFPGLELCALGANAAMRWT